MYAGTAGRTSSGTRADSLVKSVMSLFQASKQFLGRWPKGLNIEDYVMKMADWIHRLKPCGIHTIEGGDWNAVWETFFDAFQNPTKEQVLGQLVNMLRGIWRCS